jgi:hypothetical protein
VTAAGENSQKRWDFDEQRKRLVAPVMMKELQNNNLTWIDWFAYWKNKKHNRKGDILEEEEEKLGIEGGVWAERGGWAIKSDLSAFDTMSNGNQWELKVNLGKASSSFKRQDVVYEAERERVITYTWLILLGRRCWKWSEGVAHQSQTQLQIVFCLYFVVRA